MLKTTSLLSGSLLALTLLLSGCGDDPATSTPTTPTTGVTPTVTALDPTSGSADGGSQTVITGTGFTNATSILFGATSAPIFTVTSDTSITVVVPAGAAGVVPILVKTSDGGTSTSSATGQFTWLPNPLTDLSIDTTNVKAGQRLRGSVTVTYPAPDAGIRLPLTWTSTPANSTAVLVPTTVQIGAGQTTGTFEITTFFQSTTGQIKLVADHGGVGKTVTFTLAP